MALDECSSDVVDLCSPSPVRGMRRRNDGLGHHGESSGPAGGDSAMSQRMGGAAGPSQNGNAPVPSVRDVVAEASRLFGSFRPSTSNRPRPAQTTGGRSGRSRTPHEVIEIPDDDDDDVPPPPERKEPKRKRRRRDQTSGGGSPLPADQLSRDAELARRLAAEASVEAGAGAGGGGPGVERRKQEEEDAKLARQLQQQEEHSAAVAAAAARWHPPGPSGGGYDRFLGAPPDLFRGSGIDGMEEEEMEEEMGLGDDDEFFSRLLDREGRHGGDGNPYQSAWGNMMGMMAGFVPPRPGGRAAGAGGRGGGGRGGMGVGIPRGAMLWGLPGGGGRRGALSGLAAQLALRQGDFTESDYEQLLRLDETRGRGGGAGAKKTGASAADISALPTTVVPRKKKDKKGAKDKEAAAAGGAGPAVGAPEETDPCVVCLDEHMPGQTLRVLPCSHRFHKKCIDSWLKKKASCPVCVRDIPRNFQ